MEGVCAGCGAASAKQKCSRCRSTWYCGRDCQVKHWPAHKGECGRQPAEVAPVIETTEDGVDFVMAARSGDVEDVVAGIQSGVHLGATDARGNTALHVAAANGHVDVLSALLAALPSEPQPRAAILDATNEAGNTALHWSCVTGVEAAARLLLEAGASTRVPNRMHKTALDEAADRQFYPICELLVERQAPVADALDNDPTVDPADDFFASAASSSAAAQEDSSSIVEEDPQ